MTEKELEALKAEKAKAEAERELARKQIEQLKAELAVAKEPGGGAKAAAETQTAISNAQKAQADATAAAVAAQVAAEKAKFGSVTGTTFGTTTADANAGGLEASLLSAEAIEKAAARIVARLKDEDAEGGKGGKYVLFTGTQRPNLGDYRLFLTRTETILRAYKRADAAHVEADAMAPTDQAAVESETTPVRNESVAVGATAAGASLDLVAKFGSYLLSDYKFSAATVTGVDADLLAVSLAARLTDCLYPARWSPAPDNSKIYELLDPVTKARDGARANESAVLGKQKQFAAEAADAGNKTALSASADRYQRAADAYAAANKAVNDLLTSLAEADTAGVARVTRVAEQHAISERLSGEGRALVVHVGSAAGTAYTKKNLWTFLGAAPFYVSGGAIASFLVFDSDGLVKAAGQERIHSGFAKAQDVAAKLSG